MMHAAGGSRTKANAAEANAITSKRSTNAVRSSASGLRSTYVSKESSSGSAAAGVSSNARTLKSKFTELHMTPTRSTAAKARTKSQVSNSANTSFRSSSNNTSASAHANAMKKTYSGTQSLKKDVGERKKATSHNDVMPRKHSPSSIIRLSQPKRVWNSNLNKDKLKGRVEEPQPTIDLIEPIESEEVGVQTYEREILNYDMLVGDIKFMLPSQQLVQAIEHKRQADLREKLLKTERQFEEHSEHFGEHVSNLKEFLETGTITRRKKQEKSPHDLRMDRRIMQQMDEFLKRKIPKAESLTSIKERIKKKETELLGLFDTVDNI